MISAASVYRKCRESLYLLAQSRDEIYSGVCLTGLRIYAVGVGSA